PPLALISSRQISMPSSEALPPPARPPVCGMLMPILIGGWSAMTLEVRPIVPTAIVPPRNVLRFIECSRCALFFQAYWMNNAVITTYFVPRNPSHLVVYGPRPLSNPPQRRQDNLR